jgi:branched-chain amino acid transport system permease protein
VIPRLAAAAILVAALGVPLLLRGTYALHLLVLSAIWAILAVSFNIVAGYRGLLSLVHAAFFAIGAYTSGLLTVRLGASFWLGLPLAAVTAVASALLVGAVVLRLPVHAFIIATVAVGVILNLVMLNWVELTQGPMGLSGVSPPVLSLGGLEIDFADRVAYYYLVVAVLLVVIAVERRFVASRLGRACLALRENPVLAQAHGLSPLRHGLIAFALGAVGAGLAGSLYAHYMTVVSPELATFVYMTLLVVMVVVGGRSTFAGPLIGAVLFIFLPEYLRLTKAYRDSAIGLTLMLTVRFLPDGIVGYVQDAWRRLPGRATREAAAADGRHAVAGRPESR